MTTYIPFTAAGATHGPHRPTTAELDALVKAYDEARDQAAHALMSDVRSGADQPSAWTWKCGQEAQAAKAAHQLAYAIWAHDPDHPDRLESFTGRASGRTYAHRCMLCERDR